MSDNNQTVKTSWSSVQVYTLSAICLLIGVTMGYLFRGSTAPQAPSASTPAAVQTQTAGGIDASAPQSPEAMKRMAEKQVTPLLEQLKSNPNDADTLAQVAHYYIAAGQFTDAVTYYEKAVAIKPDCRVPDATGRCLLLQRLHRQVGRCFEPRAPSRPEISQRSLRPWNAEVEGSGRCQGRRRMLAAVAEDQSGPPAPCRGGEDDRPRQRTRQNAGRHQDRQASHVSRDCRNGRATSRDADSRS